MTKVSLRIDFGSTLEERIGPGKIALLESVARERSISAAARSMGMSYRRAWLLVDAMNQLFKMPVVITATGGLSGGGAHLSEIGTQIVSSYRAAEKAAAQSVREHLRALDSMVQPAGRAANRKPARSSRRGEG